MSEDSNTTVNMESVLRRVQKLLAIANDSRANPNEAAAAAGQAEKIMRKYQIDNADLLRKEMAHPEAFATADVQVRMKREVEPDYHPKKIPGWGGWLAYSTAKLHDCEIRYVITTAKGATIRFFGFAADVQVAAWTFDYLVLTTINALRAWQREATRTKAESESYRRGFVLAVCGIIDRETALKHREEQAAQQAAEASGSTSRALVIIKAASISEKYGDFSYGDAKASKANLVGSAYHAGRIEGAKVQLRAGIGANSAPQSAIK